MGARKWHVRRAEHHHDVAEFLADTYVDWAAVALFYSALHYIHSSLADEPDLPKDERHPRKHTAPAGVDNGGRGTIQVVRDIYPADVHLAYVSLFEASRRTRYDLDLLGPAAWPLLGMQFRCVKDYCLGLNQGRPQLSTQAP